MHNIIHSYLTCDLRDPNFTRAFVECVLAVFGHNGRNALVPLQAVPLS